VGSLPSSCDSGSLLPILRRFAVTIVGVTLLLLGAAMTVLPGPGILVIVAGLAVLATEYVWARRLLARTRQQAVKAQEAAVANPMRMVASLAFAVALAGLGLLMAVVPRVSWPVLADVLDVVWRPVTGGVLVVTGVVLATTTVLAYRHAER